MVLVAGGAFTIAAASTATAVTWPSSASASPAQLTSVTQSQLVLAPQPQLTASAQQIRAQEEAERAYGVHQADAVKAAAAKKAAAKKKAAEEAAKKKKAAEEAAAKKREARLEHSGTPEQIAQAMLSQFGWSSGQFSCLQPLWEEESGWNVYADNPGSGAYGIPQAMPGYKMASAGPDWQSSAYTQIKWGLEYIQSDYGSPCGAWGHEEADGWY
jgi:hypothetical protein